MSEFYEMLKEAMVGLEPYRPDQGRDAIEASVCRFEARLRTARFMAVFAVLFGGFAMVTGIVLFARADAAAPTKELLAYGALAWFGFTLTGFSKMWFALMLNHIATMKELKATQLHVLEAGERGGG